MGQTACAWARSLSRLRCARSASSLPCSPDSRLFKRILEVVQKTHLLSGYDSRVPDFRTRLRTLATDCSDCTIAPRTPARRTTYAMCAPITATGQYLSLVLDDPAFQLAPRAFGLHRDHRRAALAQKTPPMTDEDADRADLPGARACCPRRKRAPGSHAVTSKSCSAKRQRSPGPPRHAPGNERALRNSRRRAWSSAPGLYWRLSRALLG